MDRDPTVSPQESSETDAFTDLEMPDLTPKGLISHFGPGIILMMTGIGTSHLVTAPTAGGRFAFALLWCIPVAYVFKYYGFEMAFRFTNATGKSLIEAYGTAWKKWPLWYVLVTTLIQCALGQAGRLIAAAAVLYYVFTESMGLPLTLTHYGFGLGVVSVAIILRGRYKAVEVAAKVLAGILVASTLAVYLVEPAPISEMGHFFMVEIPDGSWLIIAAFLGLLPTGMDVSLQASEWGKAKKKGMSKIRERMEDLGLAHRFDPVLSEPRPPHRAHFEASRRRSGTIVSAGSRSGSGTSGRATSCPSSSRASSCSWPRCGCIRTPLRDARSWGRLPGSSR